MQSSEVHGPPLLARMFALTERMYANCDQAEDMCVSISTSPEEELCNHKSCPCQTPKCTIAEDAHSELKPFPCYVLQSRHWTIICAWCCMLPCSNTCCSLVYKLRVHRQECDSPRSNLLEQGSLSLLHTKVSPHLHTSWWALSTGPLLVPDLSRTHNWAPSIALDCLLSECITCQLRCC